MQPIKDVADAVSGVIDRLTLPAKEKKQLEADMLQVIAAYEGRRLEAQSAVLAAEAQGNWLQRSWRPLVMLTFALIILAGAFTTLPILADTSRFWDLLEIGLGGYVVGRSGEKIAETIIKSGGRKPR